MGAVAVINHHFPNDDITCHYLSKRLRDNSAFFAAEATAVTLDSMPCLQAIEGEDTENPLICYIRSLLWIPNDKGTHAHFCWIPSHCGIEGNEKVDQLAKEILDHGIDPLTRLHCADLKPVVKLLYPAANSNQVGRVCAWQRFLSLEINIRSSKIIQYITRAEELVITQLRIGHTKATKARQLDSIHNWH